MKNLRKQILTLAEAESQIKLPAGFVKPKGWDENWSEADKKDYLKELKEYENYKRGGWKREGVTIPQLISQLQQAYRKYGDVCICDWNQDDCWYDMVNGVTYDKENGCLTFEIGESLLRHPLDR
jgi:hypothetical protein